MSATRALFLLLGALALAVLLARPLCGAAHPQMHAVEPESCCHVLAGTVAKPLDWLAGSSAKPLVAAASFAYLITAAALLAGSRRFAPSPAPPRSYYARSTRILR